jgi:hypothetical protein
MISEDVKLQKLHTVLTSEQAVAIFLEKYKGGKYASMTEKSIALAASYGINAKTVRDIWCGRSWLEATFELWREVNFNLLNKDLFVIRSLCHFIMPLFMKRGEKLIMDANVYAGPGKATTATT